MSRIIASLYAAVLCLVLSLTAHGAEFPVAPKVMSGLPVGDGSWQMEMLDGPQAAEMRKTFPQGMKVCTTAAKAMVKDLTNSASEPEETADPCDTKVIENSSDRMITESRCDKASTTRVTVTRTSPKSIDVLTETTERGKTEKNKMRMTYLGACSASDSIVSGAKDSEMCKQMRAQMGEMDPAKACANAGEGKAMCEKMMADARARMAGMCQ